MGFLQNPQRCRRSLGTGVSSLGLGSSLLGSSSALRSSPMPTQVVPFGRLQPLFTASRRLHKRHRPFGFVRSVDGKTRKTLGLTDLDRRIKFLLGAARNANH